jgi:FAD/FMN-containing dehydrogenase
MTSITYEEKKQRLIDFLRTHGGHNVRLQKTTSNLFRDRRDTQGRKLDVKDFNNVLRVDKQSMLVEVEGMTPYVKLVAECLKHDVMPTVVPQLKSITVGGATTGCGIESSSFKYGLVHETVQEMEILLGDGRVVLCTPENENGDLFFGFPNSYGTLGYALKLKVKVVPVRPYVKLTHIHYGDAKECLDNLKQRCAEDIDFIDGTIFNQNEMYLTLGRFVDEAPYTSDYTFENIYYQSIRRKREDYLTIEDYLWRWDTDWFWCSKNFMLQNDFIRSLAGKSRLNSVTYTKIMRWNSKWKLAHYLNRALGYHTESVIQDIEIPVENAAKFLDFYHKVIKFMPVWVCPTRPYREDVRFDLYPMQPKKLYVNFGFWDVIKSRQKVSSGYYNKQVEEKVIELGGMKSLYSDSYFTPGQFWKIYNKPAYDGLKEKYDPKRLLKDLYAKCVLQE